MGPRIPAERSSCPGLWGTKRHPRPAGLSLTKGWGGSLDPAWALLGEGPGPTLGACKGLRQSGCPRPSRDVVPGGPESPEQPVDPRKGSLGCRRRSWAGVLVSARPALRPSAKHVPSDSNPVTSGLFPPASWGRRGYWGGGPRPPRRLADGGWGCRHPWPESRVSRMAPWNASS